MNKPKLIRITTVPISLRILLKGQLRYMSQFYDVIGVSSPGKEVEEVREVEGIRVEEIEMTRKITPLKDLVSLWKLYRFFKKEKPDMVHSHTPKAGLLGMMAAWLAGVPVRLHTVAGLPLMEAKGLKRQILLGVEKITYASATKVFPNSQGLYDFILQEKLGNPEKLSIIGNGSSNGIDTNFFSPDTVGEEEKNQLRKNLNLHPDDFIFLFIGRMVKDKGINELVEAFSQLRAENPHLKLLLVGPFEEELDPLLPETMQKIQTHPGIISVGYQSDVRLYLSVSDALVFPSYREGFPNVVMQAGAMGLPSIVSNINGCNEIIEENVNGLIIPAKNTESLRNAMEKMARKDESFQTMKKNARPIIVSRYEQVFIWEELLKVYRGFEGMGKD